MIYCFDIDGTLINTVYNKDEGYSIQWFAIDMIKMINILYDEGHTIIVQTGRHWDSFQQTQQQLSEIGLKYHTLIMGNVVADYYINDKGLKPNEFIKMLED